MQAEERKYIEKYIRTGIAICEADIFRYDHSFLQNGNFCYEDDFLENVYVTCREDKERRKFQYMRDIPFADGTSLSIEYCSTDKNKYLGFSTVSKDGEITSSIYGMVYTEQLILDVPVDTVDFFNPNCYEKNTELYGKPLKNFSSQEEYVAEMRKRKIMTVDELCEKVLDVYEKKSLREDILEKSFSGKRFEVENEDYEIA